MTPELTVLALAGLLQVLQLVIMAIPANLQLGLRKTLGSRDVSASGSLLFAELQPRTARLFRAFNNHFEGLIFFTIAVVVITLSGKSSKATQMAAYIYLVARIAYVPAYFFGLNPWRSWIWFVGFGATVFILVISIL
jgi:uncharacterized MAPEG superfamily protein